MTCSRSALVVLLTACGIVGLVAAGCGQKRPETFPVKGRVTYKGRPVTQGSIAFYPAEGRMAVGDIGPDGSYNSATTFRPGDGALPGRHRVTIDAKRLPPELLRPPKSLKDERGALVDAPVGKIEWLVPEAYSRLETTPLKAEVTSGENTINFDLR